MKSIKLKKTLPERKKTYIDISNCSNIENVISDNRSQLYLVNKLYLDETFSEKNILITEIKSKISGYRQQDIEKQIYSPDSLINFEGLIEKLVASHLQCIYCNCYLKVFYKNQREPRQWTLDRKNNNLNHSNDNTVISCLKCNLERRKKNIKDFTFTKKLSIIKISE